MSDAPVLIERATGAQLFPPRGRQDSASLRRTISDYHASACFSADQRTKFPEYAALSAELVTSSRTAHSVL